MKKETPINLANCKIGQRVRLASGVISSVDEFDKFDKILPYRVGPVWYEKSGESCLSDRSYDIIAILPLPKKKAPAWSAKEAKGLMKALGPQKNMLPAPLDKQAIKAAIKTLQALLK
jgi:hypothetical protein